MSADSPRRGGVHSNRPPQVVSPQQVNDKSIIDSVAGIINDIVPQAYTSSSPNSDNREVITWARFEYADVNDPAFYPDHKEGSSIPPLLLVLGYTTGVQIWLIAASGEATEVLSWRSGVVRTLRVLPSPKLTERARDDPYKEKRPLVAICDAMGPNNQYQNVMFMSLKTGDVVKTIKFKTAVTDVLANKRVVVITFPEKIAVFNARNFEELLTITTCYHSPGLNPNPVALGTRWLAYSEKRLIPARRSSGGSEGEGVSSYTATVLYAAKSLGKGLRGLGETVASSLTGNSVTPTATLNNSNSHDITQPGVITILDLQAAKEDKETEDASLETIVAHFTAHSEAIVAMAFDQTGALLMTADKRGHDFHVFRIQPHPGGPSLAAVHHLYVLHRGDTTAKVQDMVFSSDARWAAVSTSRGTTHVFPVAPYGGPIGVRTHSSPHVVNRLSRFHKSAGLTDDGARSHSPVSHTELPLSIYPYTNPRLPPYPHPTILHPLAQIRQPSSLNHTGSQAQQRQQPKQRLQSDDGSIQLKLSACFAPPRAWIYAQRDSVNKLTKRAVDSLFIMACHGNLIQYDLEPKPSASVPKEKVCDETVIELEVEVKGQWPLVRTTTSSDICPPLNSETPLLNLPVPKTNDEEENSNESRWLSQVEIFTHAGPHRRLWMGPQFIFKTYNAPSGVAANLVEAETVEVNVASGSRLARSNPVNMPHAATRPLVIDGSGSSYEQSPRFVEAYGDSLDRYDNIGVAGSGENQLREDLAEAMLETSSTPHRSAGRRTVVDRVGPPVAKVVNPLGTVITVSADEDENLSSHQACSSSSNDAASVCSSTICAEEGKCPIEQLDSGHTLRDHTEICAEMRSANEPAAIDTVPDDSIEELKDKRQLCAEAAIASCCSAVDLDRIGAFKDVPSSPSLCVERGAVPDCSNVSQTRTKPIVVDDDIKNARELGYQMIESHERAGLVIVDDIVHVSKEERVLSSDDDIEHVLHCDVEQQPRRKSKEKLSTTPSVVEEIKDTRRRNKNKDSATSSTVEEVKEPRKRNKDKETTPPIVEETKEIRKRTKEKESTPPIIEDIKEPRKKTKEKETTPPIVEEIKEPRKRSIDKEPTPPIVEEVKEPRKRSKEKEPTPAINEETKEPRKRSIDKEPTPPIIEEIKEPRKRSKDKELTPPVVEEIKELDPPVDIFKEPEAENLQQQQQPKKTRVKAKRQSSVNDMIEIINMDVVIPDASPSTPPLPITAVEKFEDPLTLPDMVEIIDIDAMERADKDTTPLPDCKILLPKSETSKKSKNKRHKKQQTKTPIELIECSDKLECEPEIIVIEQPIPTSSWSAIVSRRNSTKESETPEEESNKENVDISKDEPEIEKLETPTDTRESSPDEVKPVVLDDQEKKSETEPEITSIVLMDTEEENSSNDKDLLGVSALSEKNEEIQPSLVTLLPSSKKANRSKKKKRR